MSSDSDAIKLDGQKVRSLRRQKGWKREQLAELALISLGTVRNIESDKTRTRRLTAERLASTLGAAINELAAYGETDEGASSNCGFDDPGDELEPVASLSTFCDPFGAAKGDKILSSLTVEDGIALIARIVTMMPRRDVLFGLGAAVLTGIGNIGSAQADALQSIRCGLQGGKVGPEVPEWARDQIAMLNKLDVRLGGKQLYAAAHSNLRMLQSVLRERAASGRTERELRLALAHMASQAGWFAEDMELLDQAEQHYHFGLEMAQSADGQDFTVYCLTRLAAVTLAKGKPSQCLSQLEAAESIAGFGSPWRSFIHMFAVEANGRLENCGAAERTLAIADAYFDNRRADRMPDWAYWTPRPSSSSIVARSFLQNNPKLAVRLSENALACTSAEFVRSHLHLKMAFANAKRACGELDEAICAACEVLHCLMSTPMPRIDKQLLEFNEKLPNDVAAKDFKERFYNYRRSHTEA